MNDGLKASGQGVEHQDEHVNSFTQLLDQIADAQVPESAVTQYEAALSLLFTQLTDQIADGQVPESAVTQHEAALSLLFTQLTDFIADGQVPESAVTQHEAALDLLFTQLSDQIADGQVPESAVTQHEAALSLLFTQLTDFIADAQVPESAVTQHEAALMITESQISDLAHTDSFTDLLDSIADGQVPESAVTQHNAALDHGPLLGLADDDHLQYLLLAGRAGGQFAFGGTAFGEELNLQGTDDAFLGRIRVWSPIDIEDVRLAQGFNPYALRYAPTQTFTDPFVGGGFSASPIITFTNATFIWEAMRGAPQITSGVSPAFAAFTLFQALPTLSAGVGGFNPLQAVTLNAGAAIENDLAGTRTTINNTIIGASPQTRAGLSGATMNVTNIRGLVFGPKFSTVAGATVGLGTCRAVHAQSPAVAFLQPQAGTEGMTAYYGLDVDAIPFGGTVEKAAVRSALTVAVNSYFLLNTGGAWSDHGSGFMRWDDNAGLIFGTGLDIFIRWNSVQQALEYNTFFGMANSPVFFRPNGDNSWDFFSVNPLGLGYNVDAVSFGTASAEPGGNNWFVNFSALNGRQPGAGAGDYSDVLWTAGGSIDINGLAMTDVQAFRIDSPAVILNGGSIADLSNMFLKAMPSSGATRVQALRILGRARVDGHMNSGSQEPAQITADQDDYQLGENNNQRAVVLLTSDGDYNITGIDSSFGFAQTGDRIFLYNDGAFDLTLTHQDTNSLAANRFITPEALPYTIHQQRGIWLWYDDTGTARWRILATVGHLERALHLSGDQFRKGITAPTDVTIGSSPTVPALLFDLIVELASLYHSFPADLDRTQDVILRLQFSLSSAEVNLDTCDFTCDYTAPTLLTAEGVAKASTQVTGQFTAVTGRLAVGDIYIMDITFPAGDATNPLVDALGIAFEIHMTNVTGVADIHLIDGDFIYTALRS